MEKNLVSVVTPILNAGAYLDEAIASVVAQDDPNWELILVDDGSNDHSLSIALSWKEKDPRIQIFAYPGKKSSGAAKCRNFAMSKARGQYIAFLDADDTWDKNFISAQKAFLKKTGCPFVYSSYRRMTPRKVDNYAVPPKTTYQDIIKTNPITCLTVLIDTEVMGLPFMPEDAVYREDIACFFKLVREKTPFALGNPQILATYRLHIGSVSYNKWKMIRYEWRLFRKVERLGFFKSLACMAHWVFSGLRYYRRLNRKPLKGEKK